MNRLPNTQRLTFSLIKLLGEHLKKNIELMRPCRTACLLLLSGVPSNSIPTSLFRRVIDEQNPDGGWVGILDSMWSLLFLKLHGLSQSDEYRKGIQWLLANQIPGGGWGRNSRDIFRIPITGRILHFFPELSQHGHITSILEKCWLQEMNSLTYKASFTLLSFASTSYRPSEVSLTERTAQWLISQQNDDGGFAPWKDHPVGSEIYSTAIALLGLSSNNLIANTSLLHSVLAWMSLKQLGTGLWPYHQIEDGAAWALYSIYCFSKLGISS